MQNQPRRFPVGIAVAVATLVAAGSATAYLTQQRAQNSNSTPTIQQSQPIPPSQTLPPAPPQNSTDVTQPASTVEKTAQIYWLRDRGTDFELAPVSVKVKSENRPEAQLTAAMNTLLSGTSDKTVTSAVPDGTQLRSLKIKSDGIYVDLSKSFVTGGGSAAMQGRLAQVLYTATSLNPAAPVYLLIEGKPITTLGGEGLEVSQPMTRSQFEQGEGMKGE